MRMRKIWFVVLTKKNEENSMVRVGLTLYVITKRNRGSNGGLTFCALTKKNKESSMVRGGLTY